MFNLAEHEFGPDSKEQRLDAARCEKIVMELERYRAAALSYPLTVSPPLVAPQHDEAFRELLNSEGRLLQWLRGAFFLVNYEFLPDHFRLYTADMSEFAGSDPKQLLNLETGKKEWGNQRFGMLHRLLAYLGATTKQLADFDNCQRRCGKSSTN
jgi:hypothetical protein